MSRFIVVLLLAFVVSACGARDKVLLLPNDDGTSSGAAAVLSNKGETRHVIDKPYTEVAVSAGEAEFLFREGTRLRRIGERPAARSEQCVDDFLLNVAIKFGSDRIDCVSSMKQTGIGDDAAEKFLKPLKSTYSFGEFGPGAWTGGKF